VRLSSAMALVGFALSVPALAVDDTALGMDLPVASFRPGRQEHAAVRAVGATGALLLAANEHYNSNYRQAPDSEVWRREEYWAAPHEFMARGAGDCEDFAIAKYFHLLRLGVPEASLRLIIAHLFDSRSMRIEWHMVLGWYEAPGAEPLILDNVTPLVLPLSRRGDLSPRYAFNRAGWWTLQGTVAHRQEGSFPLERWHALLQRMQADAMAATGGFDPR
jgi:predicted transglutaminase-like cysteine proteinase